MVSPRQKNMRQRTEGIWEINPDIRAFMAPRMVLKSLGASWQVIKASPFFDRIVRLRRCWRASKMVNVTFESPDSHIEEVSIREEHIIVELTRYLPTTSAAGISWNGRRSWSFGRYASCRNSTISSVIWECVSFTISCRIPNKGNDPNVVRR